MLELTRFNAMMENAYEETAPHKVCSYIYDLANALNHFYHETKIMAEEDEGSAGFLCSFINTDQADIRGLYRCIRFLCTRQNVKENI